jgi:hypothetical protein
MFVVLWTLSFSYIDYNNFKIDILCYPSGDICKEGQDDLMGDIGAASQYYGSFVWAGRNNLTSALRSLKNYLVDIVVFGIPSGSGEDVLDLSQLSWHKVIHMYGDVW